MKKVKKPKPGNRSARIQTRLLSQLKVTYSTDRLPVGLCIYKIDANVIPPAGASGIPMATVFVLENGNTRTPLKAVQMIMDPAQPGIYSASGLDAPPKSKAQIWGEVTVTWQIQQTEKTTSVIRTVP